jgi:hypothetical protein
LLLGIYLRAFSFLGMAAFTYYFGTDNPLVVIISFFFLVFVFAVSGGFAGMVYTDILGKLLPAKERPALRHQTVFCQHRRFWRGAGDQPDFFRINP